MFSRETEDLFVVICTRTDLFSGCFSLDYNHNAMNCPPSFFLPDVSLVLNTCIFFKQKKLNTCIPIILTNTYLCIHTCVCQYAILCQR